MGQQGVYSAEIGALVPASEKSATESKSNLVRGKKTFNFRTWKTIYQLPELIVYSWLEYRCHMPTGT